MTTITECINQNGCCCNGCGTCGYCESLKISEVPTQSRVAANTTLLGTDSYGYTVAAIKQYLNLSNTDATLSKFAADSDTGSLLATVATNNVFACTDTTLARTLDISTSTISQGSLTRPVFITVKDESGAAGTNNITITTEGSELIDGVNSIDITADYGVLALYSDGSNLYTV